VAQREAQALAERLGEAATTCRRLGLDEVHLRSRLARTQAAEAQTVLEATGRQARRAYARYRDAGLALRGLREEFLEALHAHDRARRHPALASAHGPAASLVTPRDGRTWAPGLFIELVDPWAEP